VRLLSWNVQWCRGMDGRVDPRRIADEAKRFADPDVFCLQEVARNFPELAGSAGEDQVELLAREFAGYEAFYATTVDLPGRNGRRRFGNLVLSRLPVQRVLRHSLPWPAATEVESMPRGALEVAVETSFGLLRVTTTHLEYSSSAHRAAQIDALHRIHGEACAPHYRQEKPGTYESWERGAAALLCGDFNMKPEWPEYRQVLEGGLVDAWAHLNPGGPRPPTFHVYDGGAPFYCDYVFVTPDLVPKLRALRIDSATQASDHQPVVVELG
jgi:endonuclease/exonuclease/phosphatase family metal-dependent hydrolase